MKQALVEQGMYREEENSHLEWPDHTVDLHFFISLLMILGIHNNVGKLFIAIFDPFFF